MIKYIGIAIVGIVIAFSLNALVTEVKNIVAKVEENERLTQELAQTKFTLEQEIKQRKALEQINIDLKKREEARLKASEEYRDKVSKATDGVLDDTIPDSMLHGLHSIGGTTNSSTDTPTNTR